MAFMVGCTDINLNEIENMPNNDPSIDTGSITIENSVELAGYYEISDDDLETFMEWYFDLMLLEHDTNFYFNIYPDIDNTPLSMFPLEGLMAMYRELNERFYYVVIHSSPFDYIGYFSGDERFVNNPPVPIPDVYFRNQLLIDRDGNEFFLTPLRGVQLGRTIYRYFDDSIAIGRNFNGSDFYVNSYDDIVNIILGFDYIGVYDIGDIITLELYAGAKAFNFQVIGFYKEGTHFSDMLSPFEVIYFDQSIVMPFFVINYEPVNEMNRRFQTIFYTMKTSGNIRIIESVDALTESVDANLEIYEKYLALINEMAYDHGLVFDMVILPIPRLTIPIE